MQFSREEMYTYTCTYQLCHSIINIWGGGVDNKVINVEMLIWQFFRDELMEFYKISYAWYGVIGLVICVVVGLMVSCMVNGIQGTKYIQAVSLKYFINIAFILLIFNKVLLKLKINIIFEFIVSYFSWVSITTFKWTYYQLFLIYSVLLHQDWSDWCDNPN